MGLTQAQVAKRLRTTRENVTILEHRAHENLRAAKATLAAMEELSESKELVIPSGVSVFEATSMILRRADVLRIKVKMNADSILALLRASRKGRIRGHHLIATIRVKIEPDGSLKMKVDLFTDMPDDVANQFLNSFAFDNWGANEESVAWKHPGDGRGVSPDNIVWFWDPTTSISKTGLTPTALSVVGLYGENNELVFRPRMWGKLPDCTWQLSPGKAKMHGTVWRFDGVTRVRVQGALVRCGCKKEYTNVDGVYSMEVPASNANSQDLTKTTASDNDTIRVPKSNSPWGYLTEAGWQDPNSADYWSDQHLVYLPFQEDWEQDFLLAPPPADWRRVEIRAKLDIVDEHAIGKDIWAHPESTYPTAYLGPFADPNDPNATRIYDESKPFRASDETVVSLGVHLEWKPGGTVTGSLYAQLEDGNDIDDRYDSSGSPFTINPGDPPLTIKFSLDSGEPLHTNDHANVEVTIDNQHMH